MPMKPIKIPEETQKKLIEDFTKYLTKERMSDAKINYTASITDFITKNAIKPTVQFTPEAYLKMYTLVQNTSDEIGWHGIVTKHNSLYIITDILVYPQITTASTVTGDDDKYPEWLVKLPDEIFNKIRFQGHSHVHMATNPSGVDSNFYDAILQSLETGDYYIFCIMNKKNDLNIWLYDFNQNIIFEKEDITVQIRMGKTNTLDSWLKKNKEEYVKTKWDIKSNAEIGFQNNTKSNKKENKPSKKESEYNRKSCGYAYYCSTKTCLGTLCNNHIPKTLSPYQIYYGGY